jgi:processive 1,2-diacylglycerol beta-glucosyltransferase
VQTRVLVITADIGAGHDLPAELLAERLQLEGLAQAEVVDGLDHMGRIVRAALRNGTETIVTRLSWLFDFQYWLITSFAPARWLTTRLGIALGARGLLRVIARTRADVVVSTYPGVTEVLGHLRRAGRLDVPCVSAITDLAALGYWAHPGIDLHLVTHAESREEVLAIAGPDADVRHVRGLVRPDFEHPPAREDARAELGLAPDGPVVLVSGGGWGVGDLAGAVGAARGLGAEVVCLCGTSTRARRLVTERFGGDPHVRVEGFTADMCRLLAAADVLVHSTAGLTVLEAQICGAWAISYGWGAGHIRLNNRAYERFGLAATADDVASLERELALALASRREPDRAYPSLPDAAAAVVSVSAPAAAPPAR